MKEMQVAIQIKATKQRVWEVLWQDASFRMWAGVIDPGTYMVGVLKEGATVQFISAEGYGVTSLVAELELYECVLLQHRVDTQDYGTSVRDNQWSGGRERYTLTCKDGITTLKITVDIPKELEQVMISSYREALSYIKAMSESGGVFEDTAD